MWDWLRGDGGQRASAGAGARLHGGPDPARSITRMDAPDAALCRCGAHPGMSHGRGAGSELAFVSCGGVCSWDWLADRRHAESGAVLPPRLSSPICGRPPRARVVGTPCAGGRTAQNRGQFQQNRRIRCGLLHSVTMCPGGCQRTAATLRSVRTTTASAGRPSHSAIAPAPAPPGA